MLDQQQNDQSPINPEQDTCKLINDVEILAGTLKTDDPTVSGQLLKIATALRENKADHWASIDLYQLIDPRSVRARLLNKPRNQWFSRIEMFRNILLFAPVIVTWIGVANAVDGYYALIQNQPQLSQTPFLYLWQDGFNGTVFLTLSRLGELNAVLLVMIIIATTILSWSAIGRSSVSNDEISKRYESLVEIIGRLTNKLAETQTKSITSQLIDGINQSIEAIEQQNDAIKKNQDFVQQSQREFLSRLTEALTRIPSVELFRVNVDAVKEQIDQLASSMRAFTTSSSEMQKSVQTMAASHGQINQTLETISREIARYTTKQDAIITQVTTSSERIGEISTDFAQKLEKTAQSYITSLTESSKQYNESIADTSTRFADKMADTAQQLQLSYDRYSAVTSGANATISQVGEIITSFHEYQSQLNASSEKLTNEVNSSINIVQQRIGEMNQINDQKAQSSEAVLRGYTSTVTDLKNSIDPLSASIPAISAQLTDVNTLFSRLAPVFTSIQTATDATMQQRAAISQISDTLTQFSSNHQTLIAALESERSAQFLLAKETSQSIGQVERIKSQLEQVMADLRIISIAVTQAPPTAGSSARLRAAYRRRRRAPRAAAGNAAALQSARREPDAGSATLRDAAAPTDV
jgi:chromosome segregation ATPase